MVGKVKATIKFPITVTKKEKWYVAICPILDVASQGNTEEAAVANLTDAVYVFLESCTERGTLEQVFKECGLMNMTMKPEESADDAEIKAIDVPFYLPAKSIGGRSQCHPA